VGEVLWDLFGASEAGSSEVDDELGACPFRSADLRLILRGLGQSGSSGATEFE
jgi:hypothetical protein